MNIKFKNELENIIVSVLQRFDLCSYRDIFRLGNYDKKNVEIKREQVRYTLESMERKGTIGKRKLLGKNIFFLKNRERRVDSFLCFLKDRIVEMLSKRMLCHTAEILSELERFNIGRGAAYLILRELSISGKVHEIFGVSYKGNVFRLYYLPKKKDIIEKHIKLAKDYVMYKKLVFVDQKNLKEYRSFLIRSYKREYELPTTREFKYILSHLSYLGEINQIYFIEGFPFAPPGYATKLQNLLGYG